MISLNSIKSLLGNGKNGKTNGHLFLASIKTCLMAEIHNEGLQSKAKKSFANHFQVNIGQVPFAFSQIAAAPIKGASSLRPT